MRFQQHIVLVWPFCFWLVVAFPQNIATAIFCAFRGDDKQLYYKSTTSSLSQQQSSSLLRLSSSCGNCNKIFFTSRLEPTRFLQPCPRAKCWYSLPYDNLEEDQQFGNEEYNNTDFREDRLQQKMDINVRDDEELLAKSSSRRGFVQSTMVSSSIVLLTIGFTDSEGGVANAFLRKNKKRQRSVTTADETALETPSIPSKSKALTVEDCLLQLLPIRNSVFQNLVSMITDIVPSSIYSSTTKGLVVLGSSSTSRETVSKKCQTALYYLDSYRGKLEPTFNLDDEDTMLQIMRNERFERLLEDLRRNLETMLQLSSASSSSSSTSSSRSNGISSSLALSLYPLVKSSKVILSELGELLVKDFPYAVPTEQKFAALPRLLGRAHVTFSLVQKISTNSNNPFQKKTTEIPLGNVTIVADGYAAPLTAGNFVDLSIRNFYTGLPVKYVKKRWKKPSPYDDKAYPSIVGKIENAVVQLESTAQDLAVQTVQQIDEMIGVGGGKEKESEEISSDSSVTPILGSFLDGFVDPLTGRPRRIPLELVLAGQRSNFYYSLPEKIAPENSLKNQSERVKNFVHPFLTFDIPGLVAMNHPDRNPNGASSEFFSLPIKDIDAARVKEINGQYAPFGYVIEGWDLMQNLDPSIEISSTYVSEWGRLNLRKIKQSSFSDVINSSDSNEESEASMPGQNPS